MPYLFLIIFLFDLVLLALIHSLNGILSILLVFPLTLTVYASLCFKGFRFSANENIQQLAGKLYWIGKGTIQATLIAIFNVVFSSLVTPKSILIQFDQQFGVFASIFIFLLQPLPGFLIFSFTGRDQEQLYDLIYQEIIRRGQAPEFIILTSELLTKTQRYSEEYVNQLQKVQESVFHYIQQQFPSISHFFELKLSYRFNLENLAIFLTKKVTSFEI
ncbi:MAG: hypothetical protein ACFFAJ_01695 [Candidatus Hodarchaeota archaeon]